ncbi:isoprenoid synthase domain-containing protein [Mycena epipterygia]|nr:isoprenoid synthase domain-containing protein [Mycena epipterygia]
MSIAASPWSPHQALRDAVVAHAHASNLDYDPNTPDGKKLLVGIAYADLVVPLLDFDLKVHIAMYTWISFVIDDGIEAMGEAACVFQQRLFSGETQLTVLLECYAEILRAMYDPVVADFIIQGALAFFNCCLLEIRSEYRTMLPRKGGQNWSHFFRTKEGVSDVYAFFLFPRSRSPDMAAFLQSISDIGVFLTLGNDILSLYKEELAGETTNYIHVRAAYEERTALEVLQDVMDETIAAYECATLVLEGQGNSEAAWRDCARGYITMHTTQARYRLAEIGIGEEPVA